MSLTSVMSFLENVLLIAMLVSLRLTDRARSQSTTSEVSPLTFLLSQYANHK